MNPITVRIERASEADAEELLALQYFCYQVEGERYGDPRIPPLTQSLESLKSDISDGIVFVARLDRDIVGSVRGRFSGDVFKIGKLLVHPRVHRRGIATQLVGVIEKCTSAARAHELFTGHLSTEFIRCYEKLGYARYQVEPVNDRLELVFFRKTSECPSPDSAAEPA